MAGRRKRLDELQREKVVKLWDGGKGLTQDVLAERFGVTQSAIYDIVKREKGKRHEPILDSSFSAPA